MNIKQFFLQIHRSFFKFIISILRWDCCPIPRCSLFSQVILFIWNSCRFVGCRHLQDNALFTFFVVLYFESRFDGVLTFFRLSFYYSVVVHSFDVVFYLIVVDLFLTFYSKIVFPGVVVVFLLCLSFLICCLFSSETVCALNLDHGICHFLHVFWRQNSRKGDNWLSGNWLSQLKRHSLIHSRSLFPRKPVVYMFCFLPWDYHWFFYKVANIV